MNIPFSKPYLPIETLNAIDSVLKSEILNGNGPISRRTEAVISRMVGGGQTFLTASCTQALELSSLLLNLSPGDEVILPSFTFTSAATALVNFGVVPVFVDVEFPHLNIKTSEVANAITSKTRAISVVNYAGFPCNYDELVRLKTEHSLYLIEDNAHGLGGAYFGRPLGSFGDLSTLSFHSTKNIQSGEGGSITINNSSLLNRIDYLREKGTNRAKFLTGQIEKYQWIDKGGSFLQSEILASILEIQLKHFQLIQEKRAFIWNRYFWELEALCKRKEVIIPENSNSSHHTSHIFYLVLPNSASAQHLLDYLKVLGIQATRHYQSLHNSEAGRRLSRKVGTFENSEILASQLIRLPIWHEMSDIELDYVISGVSNFLKKEL